MIGPETVAPTVIGAGDEPVEVLDPTDGYQSHLYGLRLSAAPPLMWVAPRLTAIAEATGSQETADRAASILAAVDGLMASGLEAAVSDEYMASHWIATLAWEPLQLRKG